MNHLASEGALSAPLYAWLDRLAEPQNEIVLCDDFYLAGSAAVALHCRHRPVWSLDFMSPTRRLQSAERRDLLQGLLTLDAGSRVETARDGYLSVRTADQTGIRFFYYPYPLVAPTGECQGCEVASRLDLALMKLAAVISRGTRRDFVDLFLLVKDWPIEHVFNHGPSKFGHVLDFPLQALKAMGDRARAEGDPMPTITNGLSWSQVEQWLDGPIRDYARRQVGLATELVK